MNRGQTHVSVVLILGALATWSGVLSISIFNDHATLASLNQSLDDIKSTLDNKVVPALPYNRPYRLSEATSSLE